jgi:hypothetical protein
MEASQNSPSVCRQCDEFVTTVPQFVRDYQPELVGVWHSQARCVEGDEPVR